MMSKRTNSRQSHSPGMISKKMASLMLSTACVVAIAQTQAALAQTIIVNPGEYPYAVLQSHTGTMGGPGLGGQDAYKFNTQLGTTPDQNEVTIGSSITILGGASGAGGDGRTDGSPSWNGGNAISSNNLTITNSGMIRGGQGGSGDGSSAGISKNGGLGGFAIQGDNLAITNSGTMQGGQGGNGGNGDHGTLGGNGGWGRNAINGNNLAITNNGTIKGGQGGNGGDGGDGTRGGAGGGGGWGGDAIKGNNLTITNNGTIQGGQGSNGGNGGIGTTFYDHGEGGYGGFGGDAVNGSDLTIVNNGSIIGGAGGAGGVGQIPGSSGSGFTAIRASGGVNSLTLNTGSNITGDITLFGASGAQSPSTLSIISNAATSIAGYLIVGNNSDVIFSGQTVTFTEFSDFKINSSLIFDDFATGVALNTKNIYFNDTDIKGTSNITDWNQHLYTLVTTKYGFNGRYNDETQNSLLTIGAVDYAGVTVTNQGRDLAYSLKWNDITNNADNAYGTFDLRAGGELTLGVALADNTAVAAGNVNGWDGKSLTKDGFGTLILNASNTYTGSTTVIAGALKTGVTDAFANTASVSVSSGATLNLGGNSQTLGLGAALDNAGTVLINDWDAALLTAPVTITGNINNSGLVVLNNCTTCAGQTLAVDGNWAGNGGTVSFGTVLGGDSSLTDRLDITGDATGTTKVMVSNEGGAGAQTLEGIELITTGSSTDDAFVQDGRIVEGSYEYSLQKGTKSGANTNNWYLTSIYNAPNGGTTNIYRPEAGGYANNLAAAATMFNLNLNDRQGNSYYGDRVTGERQKNNFWLRFEGTHSQNQMIGGQLDNTANRTVFQLGGDVLGGSFDDNDLWRLGVMGGYGYQKTTTRNRLSGYSSNARVSGYSVGLYGTWYQNGQDHSGLYLDSWALYNWFDNTIEGAGLRREDYKSKGFSASIEGGYNFLAGTIEGLGGVKNNVIIRPHGQVIWSDVRANDHAEVNGTQVTGLGHGNVQTRLGLRLSLSPVDRQASYSLEPFVEMNWLHNTKPYGVRMGSASSFIEGSQNLGEIKVGLEGRFNDRLSLWGSLGHQFGSNGYQETRGIAGLKYRF